MADNTLFEATPTQTTNPPQVEDKDYVTELVGEGKKFKDVSSLARGKAESDAYIEHLKREMDSMRQELNTRLTLEQFMDRVNQTRANSDGNRESGTNQAPVNREETRREPNEDGANNNNTRTAVTQEDIERIIEEREQKRIAARHVNEVKQKLQEAFGPNYVSELDNRARELGVTRDHLNHLASTSPKAFFQLIGEMPTRDANAGGALFGGTTQVNTASRIGGGQSTGEKTYSYYQKMRRDNPALYHSKEMVAERHRQAQKLGERFFDS